MFVGDPIGHGATACVYRGRLRSEVRSTPALRVAEASAVRRQPSQRAPTCRARRSTRRSAGRPCAHVGPCGTGRRHTQRRCAPEPPHRHPTLAAVSSRRSACRRRGRLHVRHECGLPTTSGSAPPGACARPQPVAVKITMLGTAKMRSYASAYMREAKLLHRARRRRHKHPAAWSCFCAARPRERSSGDARSCPTRTSSRSVASASRRRRACSCWS